MLQTTINENEGRSDVPPPDVSATVPPRSEISLVNRGKFPLLQESSPCYTISRVPAKLRAGNKEAYTPQVVSIGPLHRGKPELRGMERFKRKYLQAFLCRTSMKVERCMELIRDWEETARGCYAESLFLSSDEFAEMVLVDSGFIIESILRCWFKERQHGISELVRFDLILVENQLPFFVVQGIFQLAFVQYRLESLEIPPFLDVLVFYFKNLFLMKDMNISGSALNCIPPYGIKHFVDLLRIIHLPKSMLTRTGSEAENALRGEYVRVKTATELQEVGMEIKCIPSSSRGFLGMKYQLKGVLEIPKFCINGSTEFILRNLIALEVLLYERNSYIIDCAVFMDDLIDTARDFDILEENGVMGTDLGGSEAVATMCSHLRQHVVWDIDNYYFSAFSTSVNRRCDFLRDSHKSMATMSSNPFKAAAIIAVTVYLVLILIQTVCSVISHYR